MFEYPASLLLTESAKYLDEILKKNGIDVFKILCKWFFLFSLADFTFPRGNENIYLDLCGL